MKKLVITILVSACLLLNITNAQTFIQFQNPSFEGTPGTPHVTPLMWSGCMPGFTPDTQPNCWGVTLPSSNGNSYLGLTHALSTNWQEGASQTLSSPLTSGETYSFSIDLATTNTTQGGITPGPIELEVWGSNGGNSGCDLTELLWSSGNIIDTSWQTHNVFFTPSASFSTLVFMAHNIGSSDNPYLLVDNIANGYSNGVHAYATPTSCYGVCDGIVHAFMIGGTPPFQYSWFPTGATTPVDSNLCNGVYVVTVIDSNNVVYMDTTIITSGLGPSPLSAPQICIVSVDTTVNKNLIVWDKPLSTAIDSFIVYRETSMSGNYIKIGSQPYATFSTFTDMNSFPLVQANRYKIAIKDSCGALTSYSNEHKTIHLTISAGMGGAWNLNWDSYEGFPYSTFDIYRGTSLNNMTLLTSIASTLFSYTDVAPPPGIINYMIVVSSPGPCNPSIKSGNTITSSLSNIANNTGIGINEIESFSFLSFFPNPTSNNLTIETHDKATIEIHNLQGQLIKTFISNGKETTINVANLASGVYIIKAVMEKGVIVKKFIKE